MHDSTRQAHESQRFSVHEGGARSVRSRAGAVAVGFVMVSAIALVVGWKTGSHDGVCIAAVATIGAPLAVIAAKLSSHRTLEIAPSGWSLAPVVGKKRRMARVGAVRARGEDVIVEAEGGQVIVLGVLGGGRRSELIRRTLVAGLEGFGTFAGKDAER